ncbi:hypothetical protein WS81_30295 [Burkholderia sp. MSMB2040]|nr:hypothetical protein WS78_19720 [Burkholderia savannae]KVG48822.1 hypothetical protein WS77_03625 [Burkholderia sp. MSMB0265]KVG86282.1 hypothetical protein WS81_30295 [Burkholderia sp. MSMB2040]KVG90560.1 hypothetical protein WS82_17760 [Burkholderia sp. MSMB2041]
MSAPRRRRRGGNAAGVADTALSERGGQQPVRRLARKMECSRPILTDRRECESTPSTFALSFGQSRLRTAAAM